MALWSEKFQKMIQIYPKIYKIYKTYKVNTKGRARAGPGPRGPWLGPGRLPLGILYLLCISWIYLGYILDIFGYVFGIFLVYFWYIFGIFFGIVLA